ncbi:hypothetical protein D3C72_2307520 [compost metagenome]
MGEAAAGQHHAAAGADPHLALCGVDQGAADPAVFLQQLAGTAPGVDRDAQVQGRLGQPCRQRIAAGDVDAAAVQRQFLDMGG